MRFELQQLAQCCNLGRAFWMGFELKPYFTQEVGKSAPFRYFVINPFKKQIFIKTNLNLSQITSQKMENLKLTR